MCASKREEEKYRGVGILQNTRTTHEKTENFVLERATGRTF
jgi:hypothetical protein